MTALVASEPSFDLLEMDRKIQRRATLRRVAKLTGWTGAVALCVSRGGVLGWVLAAGGMYGLARELVDWRDSRPEWKKEAGSPLGRAPQVVKRLLSRPTPGVDTQSKLSFPASDPPANEPH